jgi:hypothetical protein
MSRWQRSKQLAAASWDVVREDKELLVLPLISGITCLVLGGMFLLPVLFTTRTTATATGSETSISPVGYVLLFLMYLVLAYVTVFFKVALLCGAEERMRGEDPSLGSALSAATDHAGKILPWAIVSATVSMLLRTVEERAGFLGRIAVALVGVAWAAVTFLVLPVLVFEGVGVVEAIKRSGSMLKRTWGENLIVNGGIGLVAMVAMLPAVLVAALGIVSGSAGLLVLTLAVAIGWVIVVSCWSSAMTAVFQMALYRYATDLEMPPQFATVDMAGAFVDRSRG